MCSHSESQAGRSSTQRLLPVSHSREERMWQVLQWSQDFVLEVIYALISLCKASPVTTPKERIARMLMNSSNDYPNTHIQYETEKGVSEPGTK